MVLHWRRCGRVGHRRIKFGEEPQSKDWGSFFVYTGGVGFWVRWVVRGADGLAGSADSRRDCSSSLARNPGAHPHWRRCGRVGHRRIKFGEEPQSKDWGSFFVCAGQCLGWHGAPTASQARPIRAGIVLPRSLGIPALIRTGDSRRVDYRRIKFGEEPQLKDWGSFFVYTGGVGFWVRWVVRGADGLAGSADSRRDCFSSLARNPGAHLHRRQQESGLSPS